MGVMKAKKIVKKATKTMKAKKAKPEVKLTYLDLKGFAEPIRLALTIGGIKFEDERVDREMVKVLREAGKNPWGQVPVLSIDGKTFGQSQAILRWAGRQAGLYPDKTALECDAVLNAISDLNSVITPAYYGAAIPGRHPVTGALCVPLSSSQWDAVKKTLNEEILPGRFAYLEQALHASGGPYFCGKKITICDLAWYSFASELIEGNGPNGIDSTIPSRFPRLSALVQKISGHPKVKKWNEQYA